ncbi:UNVERIFIED_CONTAM: hypothetical protein Sindi_1816900 [Sesamum indicum]
MDPNVICLGRSLVLTEDEEEGVQVILFVWAEPLELWGLLVVGRLLTPKAFQYDVLKNMLMALIRPGDNRAIVDLNWCSFYIHVYDLPIWMMMQEVTKLTGRAIYGCGFFSNVGSDYTYSSSIARSSTTEMNIETANSASELVLGHILRECPKFLDTQAAEVEDELRYGSWLRESRSVGILFTMTKQATRPRNFDYLKNPVDSQGGGTNVAELQRENSYGAAANLEEIRLVERDRGHLGGDVGSNIADSISQGSLEKNIPTINYCLPTNFL